MDELLGIESVVDLLGFSETWLHRLRSKRGAGFPEIPASLEQLRRTPELQRRIELAASLVAGAEAALAVTGQRRVIACNEAASRLLWRSSAGLLGTPISELVRPALDAIDDNEQPEARRAYERDFAQAFDPDSPGSEEPEAHVERPTPRPIPIALTRAVWKPAAPARGYARFEMAAGGQQRDRQAELDESEQELCALLAAKTGSPWRLSPMENASYPALGGGDVRVTVSFSDVQLSSKGERGKPVRVYRLAQDHLRAQITQHILELEYRAMNAAAYSDEQFAKTLWSYLEGFFEEYAPEITRRFPAESATIFILRVRGDDEQSPKRIEGDDVTRALLPIASHGILPALDVQEIYHLDGDEATGVIPEFVLRAEEPVRWIPFSGEAGEHWRTCAKAPNFENVARNARLGGAFNALLIKLSVPRRSDRDRNPTQAFGALRLVNCFQPAADGFAPVPDLPFWTSELVEVAEHLAIMFQQWLRIARRSVIARAVERLARDSSAAAYLAWLTQILRAVLDFSCVAVWQGDKENQRLTLYGSEDGRSVDLATSASGIAFVQDETIDIDTAIQRYPGHGLGEESAALGRNLKSGFAILIRRQSLKWGVMSFYNTGATIDFRASFYRDETLQFCQTLAGLVSAKIELEGASSSASAPDERRLSRPD